jgi:uncharacterized protein
VETDNLADQQLDSCAETLGHVLAVTGSQASMGVLATNEAEGTDARITVGQFVVLRSGTSLLIAVITKVSLTTIAVAREQGYYATAELDLMGEIRQRAEGSRYFQRGVTAYPAIGDPATLISSRELRLIYDLSGSDTINIGTLLQDAGIGAYVHVDDMLRKHFAILGTTGVGKSSGVAVILQQILDARPDLRLFLLDGHNEYGRCFGDRALVLNPRNVKLPFWLFNFEEIVDVIFGNRPGVEEEVEILSEVIPLAKGVYTQYKGATERSTLKRTDPKATGYTVDTPVPYRLADLVSLIDERMGKLENRSSRMKFHRLIMRIETVRNDPRYSFMFENANVGGDTMAETLGQLFRLPPNGRPMTIMQLAGFPSDVVDAVVSVLCRMAFDFGLWSDGAIPLLFVCEEAHRYAAADRSLGFGPTRKAIARIAKEGRKYGVFLGLVTQRPAELDPTIISQCSTLFAMRMANDRDQALLRSAVSDAAANLLAFVPSLGTREVLAFGEGVALPTRLKFKEVPTDMLPKSETVTNARLDPERDTSDGFLESVIDRWRGATMSHKQKFEDGTQDLESLARQEFAPLQPGLTLDPDRFKLLKKPIEAADVVPQSPSRWPPK